MSHQTHYRSYQGPNQQCQSTEGRRGHLCKASNVLHAFVLGEQNVLGMSKAIPANDRVS